MAKYKIEYDRAGCIRAGPCAAVAPQFWKIMGDGKASIIGGKNTGEDKEELEIDEKDFQANLEAAQVCPVNVIHIKKLDTNEQII